MITTKIELLPFTIPTFVIPVHKPGRRQDGFKPIEGIPIHTLDDETINQLIEQFRIDLWSEVIENRNANHE